MKQMKYSRRLLAAAAIVAGLGVGAVGVGTTLAAQADHGVGMGGLVEAIAEKFDLKVADVQAVFDEQRQEMEASLADHEAEALSQAVADGKVTQAQADAMTAKRQESKGSEDGLREFPHGGMRGFGMKDGSAHRGFGSQGSVEGSNK